MHRQNILAIGLLVVVLVFVVVAGGFSGLAKRFDGGSPSIDSDSLVIASDSPIAPDLPQSIASFDPTEFASRGVMTGAHCFGFNRWGRIVLRRRGGEYRMSKLPNFERAESFVARLIWEEKI